MSTFCGLMEEYRSISIDRFDGINLQSTVYMLSHNHKDHTTGLDSSAFQYRLCSNFGFKLYCSEVTRDLLILSPTYRPIEKSIIALPIDSPQVIKIPQGNDYGSENDEEEITVTLIQAGHCPGSVMFLIDGSEGRVLYTGDFRLSHEELMSFDIMREMGGAFSTINAAASSTCTRSGGLRSLYIDTTFCVPEAAYIPRREETTEAALAVISDWIALSPKHIVLLKCGADIGYENLFMRISEACSMKIHVDMKKFNQCRVLSGMLDCVTADPSLTQIHACRWRERHVQRIIKTKGPRLPCGYEDPSGELKLRTVIFSTMFFVQTVDMDSYVRRVGESTFRICYSFHPSYSEVRDLIVSLRPERAFPNVIPAYEHTGMTMQDRLNEFVALSHSISNKVTENTQLSDSQSSEVQTLGTLKSSKSLQNIFHRGTITGRKSSNLSIRRRHRKKKAFSLNKSFPASVAIPKVRASFVFGDSQASEGNYISSSSSSLSNLPSLEFPLVSPMGEGSLKVERELKPLNSESFEVERNLAVIPEESVKTEITTELKVESKIDLDCKTEVEKKKNCINFSSIKIPKMNTSTNVADSIFSKKNNVGIKSDAEVSDIESKLLAHKLWAKSSHSTASSSNDIAANTSTAGVESDHSTRSDDVVTSNDSRVPVNDRESMVSNSISSSNNTSHCVSNGKDKNTSHSINNFICNAAACSTNNFENYDSVDKSTEDVLISKCEPIIIHQSDQKIENQKDENNCQHQVSENVSSVNEQIELCNENEICDNFSSCSDVGANPSADQNYLTSITFSKDAARDVANVEIYNSKNSYITINSNAVCSTSTSKTVHASNSRNFNASNPITGDRELVNIKAASSTAKITPERRSVNRYDTPRLKSYQICSKISNTKSAESVADNFFTNIHPTLGTKQILSTSVSEINENVKSNDDKGTITKNNDVQFQYSEVVGENCASNVTNVVKAKERVICEPSSSRIPCAFEVDDDVVLISCSSLSNNQENSSSVGQNNKCVTNLIKNDQCTNGKARVRRRVDWNDSDRSNFKNEDIEHEDVARKVRKLQKNHNSGKNLGNSFKKKSADIECDEVEGDSDDEPNEIVFAKVNTSISCKNQTFSKTENSLANKTLSPISYFTEKPTISSERNEQLISKELNSRRSDKSCNNTSIHGSASDTALLDAYSMSNNTPYSQDYYKKEELSDKIKTNPILHRSNSGSKRGLQRLIRTNSGSPKIGPPADEVVVDLCGRNVKIQPVPEQWLCSKKPSSACKPKRAAESNNEKSGKFCKDKDVIIIEESPQKSTAGNVFINEFYNNSEECFRRTDNVALHDNIFDKIEISKPADELTSRIEPATSVSKSSENEILPLLEKKNHNNESSTVASPSATLNDLRDEKINNVIINDLASSVKTTTTNIASVLSPLLPHDCDNRISSTVNDSDVKELKTPCKSVGKNAISPLYEIVLSSGSSNATTIGDGRDFSPQLSSLSPAAKCSKISLDSIHNQNSPESKRLGTSFHRTGSAVAKDFILTDSSLSKVACVLNFDEPVSSGSTKTSDKDKNTVISSSNSNSRPILTNDSEIVAPSNNIINSNCNGNSMPAINTNSEVEKTNTNRSSEEIIGCSLDSSLGTNESYSNSGSLFSD